MSDARWRILPDPSALAETAARMIVMAINDAGATPSICLTGGSTPRRVYELLGQDTWAAQIPWARVHWFVGDERFVPEADARSNMGQARRLFLDSRAPQDNIHSVVTQAADVHAAAQGYDAALRALFAMRGEATLFDLVLLGVGPDGHVASLFPGAAATRDIDRWVVGVDQAGREPYVPRISLTFGALSACDNVLFMAEGAGKEPVLSRVARGDDLPATRVTARREVTWLVDADAAPPRDLLGPRLILVMGVSGSGKTTVGAALAARLGWSFLDADDLHSDASKAKMHAGAPLTDADRAPWLERLREELARRKSAGADVVLACSALKRPFRAALLSIYARNRIVHLRGAPSVIAARLQNRTDHFASPALLDDQLSVLEDPAADEQALIVDVDGPPPTEVDFITARLDAYIRAGRFAAQPEIS